VNLQFCPAIKRINTLDYEIEPW